MDPLEGPALVAELDGVPVGLVAWLADGPQSQAEVRVLVVEVSARSRGVGGRLLDAAIETLQADGIRAAWLVTTNDNRLAIDFYGRRGWRLAEVRRGAVDAARERLKPSIPRVGGDGTPIRDELVLCRDIGER